MTDSRKTQQTDPNRRRLWVWPYGKTATESPHMSLVDEMNLEYEHGLPISVVRRRYAEALREIRLQPEEDEIVFMEAALEESKGLVGFWVVGHDIWEDAGRVLDVHVESDEHAAVLNLAILRFVASRAFFHVGAEFPE